MRQAQTYIARPVGKTGPVKIGCSLDPKGRLPNLKRHGWGRCELLVTIPGAEWERRLHVKFYDRRIRGEWFEPSGEMERMIDGIQAGSFDLESLPPIRKLTGFRSKGPGPKHGADTAELFTTSGVPVVFMNRGNGPEFFTFIPVQVVERAAERIARE